jgi:hypothetical protein
MRFYFFILEISGHGWGKSGILHVASLYVKHMDNYQKLIVKPIYEILCM